jgi:pimeloyl-ACP methyl ester carboxylesterase
MEKDGVTRFDSMPPAPELQSYAQSMVVDGLRLHYYDTGPHAAVPVVLIHGLGDEADTWRHIFPALARWRRVIALDLPGFGRSEKPRRAYTLAFFARTIGELLDALGIRRAVLVGHSMGAAVAQRLALAQPDCAEQLVLIGGGLPTEARRPPAQLWLFLAPGLGEILYTSLRRSQAEAYATLRPYYSNLEALPQADQAFLRERVWARVWSAGQRRAFLSALRWLAIDQATRADAFRARLAHSRVPTTILWGEQDLIVPQAAGAGLAALLPDARLQVIAGSGHLPHQEQPDQVLDALHKILTN